MTFDYVTIPSNANFSDFAAESQFIDFGRRVDVSRLPEMDVGDIFDELVAEWMSGCMNVSSIDELIEHPAYQRIIELGVPVLPYLFADLRSAPKPWFYALRQITGASPIPSKDAGNFDAMVRAWSDWGTAHGFLSGDTAN